MKEARVGLKQPLVPRHQPAGVAERREGALDYPPPAVAAQLAPVLIGRPRVVAAGRDDRLDASALSFLADGENAEGRRCRIPGDVGRDFPNVGFLSYRARAMVSKEENDRRKSIRDDLKRGERKDAEAKLPLPKPEMKQLFDWVDAKLRDEGCDHTLRHSTLFLRRRGVPEDEVIAWLKAEGGYCDCEVVANAEERWREIIGGET